MELELEHCRKVLELEHYKKVLELELEHYKRVLELEHCKWVPGVARCKKELKVWVSHKMADPALLVLVAYKCCLLHFRVCQDIKDQPQRHCCPLESI